MQEKTKLWSNKSSLFMSGIVFIMVFVISFFIGLSSGHFGLHNILIPLASSSVISFCIFMLTKLDDGRIDFWDF